MIRKTHRAQHGTSGDAQQSRWERTRPKYTRKNNGVLVDCALGGHQTVCEKHVRRFLQPRGKNRRQPRGKNRTLLAYSGRVTVLKAIADCSLAGMYTLSQHVSLLSQRFARTCMQSMKLSRVIMRCSHTAYTPNT